MGISREEVRKVALLARLSLSETEVAMMADQLGQVLDYMGVLAELNTDRVEPMAHALEVAGAFRPDVVAGSLDRETALANAPSRDGECYRVPAVLGET